MNLGLELMEFSLRTAFQQRAVGTMTYSATVQISTSVRVAFDCLRRYCKSRGID